MSERLHVTIDGAHIEVDEGTTVAAALMIAGAVRPSVSGEPRQPICGMGVCFECRVRIDGRHHDRGCMVLCREGMEVRTGV